MGHKYRYMFWVYIKSKCVHVLYKIHWPIKSKQCLYMGGVAHSKENYI